MTNPLNRDLQPSMLQSSISPRLQAALEHKPPVQIPADFAARVATLAAARPLRARRKVPQIGTSVALLSVPLVAAALFVLAPHSSPNVRNLIFDTEVVLIAELALIGWWVSRTLNLHASR